MVTIISYHYSMKSLTALNTLADLCASQRGMLTTAQARGLGVSKMTLSRLSRHGQLESVIRGVYRVAASPSFREKDVHAAWLALDPLSPAYERPADSTGPTASHNTAAWLLGLGELKPEPMVFSFPRRKQSRDGNIRFFRRELPPADVTVAGGIPYTTPRRTVLDLIDAHEDLSLIATVLRDTEATGTCVGIEGDVNARASACGFPESFALYDYLRG